MPRMVFDSGNSALISRMPSIVSTALPDVLLVARAAREDQRVEEDVLGGRPVLLGQEREAAARDLELALPRHAHAVLGVLVDRADDERGAVLLGQGHDRPEALLAVLEVDRVDDRLALAPLQSQLEDPRVGRVEHQRDLDHLRRALEELVRVGRPRRGPGPGGRRR